MPKFFCEYCGIYLTHSSPSGRSQHAKGRKHINNRIEYYKQVVDDINKENADKMKQMQVTSQTAVFGNHLNFPQSFQNPQQAPMLLQIQQLSAGGISQVQIQAKPVSQQQSSALPPTAIPPQFMNMKQVPPTSLLPPGTMPLRQGTQPPINMIPPANQALLPIGMKSIPQINQYPPFMGQNMNPLNFAPLPHPYNYGQGNIDPAPPFHQEE